MPRPRRHARSLFAICLALLPAAAWAAPETYALDPVHTRVVFAVRHAGFSDAIGTVSGSTGTIRFDPDDWSTATLAVEIPLNRLDLGDAAWNEATLGRKLLATDSHPVARFTSTGVEAVAPDRARVHGTLELRGVARPIVLDVVLNAHKRHPMPPFRRTVGFSATTTLSRADFGMTAWATMIGDDVSLQIEVEATRQRGDGDGDSDSKSVDGDGGAEQSLPAADATAEPAPEPPTEPDSPR